MAGIPGYQTAYVHGLYEHGVAVSQQPEPPVQLAQVIWFFRCCNGDAPLSTRHLPGLN